MKKIRYSKERLRSNYRLGIFFVLIGIVLILLSLIMGDWKNMSLKSVGVGQILAGIPMFILYYFEKKKQYLTIDDGVIVKNTLIPKRIKLSEINSIREFAGDLKLITNKSEFVIDTQIIESDSLIDLKNELKKHHLENI
ncbi:hypothetical protein DFQ11_10641 [Winogradskyella epiphytica]|uniref:PH (Pleckstrin Homology) domain-containing protein n=1 Tax=Winogradskyella epiphytica TaxID=262005 RepID=A0A2V4XX74_9FLAO|nr:hypothetical protein [Winogradskyella epiphytica]PYE80243.1 hypothetical protein DFQ11_10641 [Winogradskyella epiphytica]GGW70005.1 hypothetical protein GCM10008085_22450 [Winogradskyella epiphytica]